MPRRKPDLIALMESYGVDLYEEKGDEKIGDCPFCGKESHFFVNHIKNKWICHQGACAKSGGYHDYLGYLWKTIVEQTTTTDIHKLADYRKLPHDAFANVPIGCLQNRYFLPVILKTDAITDLRTYYIGKKCHSSTGVIIGIYNGAELFRAERQNEDIYLCEGEWDCIALNYLLKKANKPGFAVAIPGVQNFKSKWSEFFTDRHVYICFDHDGAGELNTFKISEKLSTAKTVEYLRWPEEFPLKFDVNDYVSTYAVGPGDYEVAFNTLCGLFRPTIQNVEKVKKISLPDTINYDELLTEYRKVLSVNDDFEQGIQICLATKIAVHIPGPEPLWMFIVGPPGYGKTALLSTFKEADDCYYLSTLTRHQLVSGFRTPDNSDPSIFSKLHGGCLILKDWTEILGKAPNEREEIYDIFRGAFDGSVARDFGNNIKRRYDPLSFSMLAGVTDEIKHYNQASLGERFLRFNIDISTIDYVAQQEQALISALTGDDERNNLQQYVAQFLRQKYDFSADNLIKRITPEFRSKLIALAELTAHMRTTVKRHEKGLLAHTVSYKPRKESGNRLAIQFQRLSLALALILERPILDNYIFSLIRRIAFNTIDSYSTDICCYLATQNEPVDRNQLVDNLNIPKSSISFYMEDLKLLNLVDATQVVVGKAKTTFYSLQPTIHSLWSQI